jgi:hypothetical protein
MATSGKVTGRATMPLTCKGTGGAPGGNTFEPGLAGEIKRTYLLQAFWADDERIAGSRLVISLDGRSVHEGPLREHGRRYRSQ